MIHSMTGYSRIQAEEAGFSLSFSIRSTNHRFLDLQVRLPAGLESLETLVRRLLKDHVARGHVEVTVGLERAGAVELQLNRKLVAAYVAAYQTLRAELGSASEPDLVGLLRIPGLVTAGDGEFSSQELERVQQVLQHVAIQALEHLNKMRAREGEALERDLRVRLARLEALRESVAHLSERVPCLYRERLESRIGELLASKEMDEARSGSGGGIPRIPH